jgi:Fe2+ transport system protein FeoA
MFVAWVTMNVSQRIAERLVQRPAPVTFNLSQCAGEPDRNPALQRFLSSHKLCSRVDKAESQSHAESAPAPLCPLSEVQAGTSVLIKQLSASPEMSKRLRELGFCEEQRIKLLSRNPNLICQVCNARLGLSSQLADLIWVEKIKPQRLAA